MNGIAQKFITDQKGMTLIDMSIMILVIGIMAAPMFQAYNIWKIQATRENTQGAQNTSAQAIDNYYFTNDFYPCPADPTLGPQDQGYGEPDVTIVGGVTTCNQPMDPANQVVFGALPFKALKIPPAQVLDGYRNKLLYAVTESLTHPPPTFVATEGKIKVSRRPVNQFGECDPTQEPVDTGKNYHFIMMSLGANGRGAYNEDGIEVATCVNSPSVPGGGVGGGVTELENCERNDVEFVDSFCMTQDSNPLQETFDDFIYEGYKNDDTVPTKIWDTASDPNNLGSKDLYLGIGTSTPAHELDVAGNIRATTKNPADPTDPNIGKAYAGVYCTDTGSGCFSAVAIAGNDPNMTCSSGKGMNGIAYAQAKCQNTISTSTLAPTNCPNGQYAKGVDAAGNIICGVP